VLQPLAVQCRPATLPSWGHRWGAAGLPGPAAWLPGAGDRRQERAAVLQLLGAPRWSAHPYLSAVVRDLIRQACCWAMAMSPGGTADRGHHMLGYPVRRSGSQGRVIAGRSELQCCNRSRCSVGRRRCRARVTGGALLGHGQVPGRGGAPKSSPGGRFDPAAWPSGGG
jgi:hypothetical protein